MSWDVSSVLCLPWPCVAPPVLLPQFCSRLRAEGRAQNLLEVLLQREKVEFCCASVGWGQPRTSGL